MFLTAGAAVLAFDFVVRKSVRVLRHVHDLYGTIHSLYLHPLQEILRPLHISYKLGLATTLAKQYECCGPGEHELALRFVLTCVHRTAEELQMESQRLHKLSDYWQKKWIHWNEPCWTTEAQTMVDLTRQLDEQLLALFHLGGKKI